MFQKVSKNDIGLIASMLYICFDVTQEWQGFDSCSKPVHQWIFGSCLCAVFFRLTRFVATHLTAGDLQDNPSVGGKLGEMLLVDLCEKGDKNKALAKLTWAVTVPFFSMWTLMGSAWAWDVAHTTPQCMPSETYIWFIGLWVLVCNAWIAVHAVLGFRLLQIVRTAQRGENNLLQVEDAETMARWGGNTRGSWSRTFADAAAATGKGLTPAEIKSLPCSVRTACDEECECAICLTEVCVGDQWRILPRCGHTFHRPCIDLWLVRSGECPLCKQRVMSIDI